VPAPVITGLPGTTWTNDGGKVRYQFVAELRRTCGVCLQYHLQIGASWPIPIHFGCRCRQVALFPGDTSQPFANFREVLRDLDPHQQAAAVGSANYRLIEAGVVRFEDVVTEGRVRDLREVVSLKGLSLEALETAGVPKAVAEQAHRSVTTPAHRLAADSRARTLVALRAKGVSDEEARRAVSSRLAARVTIGAGPSGPQGSRVTPWNSPPMPPEELANRLGVKLRPVPSPGPSPPGPVLPGRPIAEPIAADAEGDRLVDALAEVAARRDAALAPLAAGRAAVHRETALQMDARVAPGAGPKERAAARAALGRGAEELRRIAEKVKAVEARYRDEAHALLKVDDPAAIEVEHAGYVQGRPLDPLGPVARESLAKARRWLESVTRRGDRPLSVSVGQIGTADDPRAAYYERVNVMKLGRTDEPDTAVHELGHFLDEQLTRGGRKALESSLEFLNQRVGRERPRRMSRVAPGCGYRDDETGRKDRFDRVFDEVDAYYTGKDYRGEAAEVLAMGVQVLYQDPLGFAAKDAEYFKWVVGVLHGRLL
jgi:hypothetical protein